MVMILRISMLGLARLVEHRPNDGRAITDRGRQQRELCRGLDRDQVAGAPGTVETLHLRTVDAEVEKETPRGNRLEPGNVLLSRRARPQANLDRTIGSDLEIGLERAQNGVVLRSPNL